MDAAVALSPGQETQALDGLDHQDADKAWKPKTNPWVIALTVTLATFMEILDSSIANVSPLGTFNDMGDANPEETFARAVDLLNSHRPGYLHVVEDTTPADRNGIFSGACVPHGRASMSPTADTMLSGASARFQTEPPMPSPMAASSSRTRICLRG